MHLNEAKDVIYDLVKMFFQKAEVIWEEQENTIPTAPYVSMKLGKVSRNTHVILDDDGNRIYEYSTLLELNLYTKGKKIPGTTNYMNTATSDMMEFCSFLESEFGSKFLSSKDVVILLNPPVRDLSELQNDSKYRYRSMAEFNVSYIGADDGMYGLSGMVNIPNASGGGTMEMVHTEIDPITSIEISYEEEE